MSDSKRFGIGALAKIIAKSSVDDYAKAREFLERAGDWPALQMLQHNAERIGIARQGGLPFPSREGYGALGLVGMGVIATRDQIRSGRSRLTPEEERIANECTEKAERYGWEHEAWKFNWILFRRGRQSRLKYLGGFWRHFWNTQYLLTSRIFQLLLN